MARRTLAVTAQTLAACVLIGGCAAGSVQTGSSGDDASSPAPSEGGVDGSLGARPDAGGGGDSGSASDASAADGSTGGSCPQGAPCPAPQVCHQGVIDCSTGMAVCADMGPAPNGTSCGTDQVCGNGTCNACTQGAACTPTNPCQTAGTTDCSTGTPVCAHTSNVPDGTACGGGHVCTGGACAGQCSAGSTESCAVCGTTGTASCTGAFAWGSCAPPSGICSYVDQGCSAKCDTVGSCWPHVDRSYDASNGFHFYTTNDGEAACCGYAVEYLDYYYLYSAANAGLVPFYRCSLGNGSHLYTTSSTCEGAGGATNEGSMGYIATSQVCGSVPLYRLYDATNGDHFYTTSSSEAASAEGGGYATEGIAGYVWTAPEK